MAAIINLNKKSILTELGLTNLTNSQQEVVWQLILDIFQTRVVDFILSELPTEQSRREFLLLLGSGNQSQIKKFLTAQIDEIELKLAELVKQIKSDLKFEITAAQEET